MSQAALEIQRLFIIIIIFITYTQLLTSPLPSPSCSPWPLKPLGFHVFPPMPQMPQNALTSLQEQLLWGQEQKPLFFFFFMSV